MKIVKKRAALHSAVFSELDCFIAGKMKARLLQTVPVDFTHDDILNLFVPPEHHSILRNAYEVVNINYNLYQEKRFTVRPMGKYQRGTFIVTINPTNGSTLLAPRLPVYRGDDFPELHSRFTSWVTARVALGQDIGRAAFVLRSLNDFCATPGQIRFVWPALLTLAKMAGMDDLARQITDFTPPRTQVDIPVMFRELMRQSLVTVTAASLLEPPNTATSTAPCEFELVGEPISENGYVYTTY